MGARAVNAILGLWLFLSTFLWSHSRLEALDAWIVGIAVVTLAVVGISRLKWPRYVNAILGAWLILTAILMRSSLAATRWNSLIVGFGLVLFGLSASLSMMRHTHDGKPSTLAR
jgi:hypothetical protein